MTLSGTATVQELWADAASLTLQGTLDLSGAGRVNTLTQTGTLTGGGELSVATSLAWNGGTMKGSGTTVIEIGATATTADVTLDQRTLRNQGSVSQAGSSRLFGKNGAVVDNRGTLTLNSERCFGCSFTPGVVWTPAGDAEPRLVSTGVIQRTGGSASSYTEVSWGLENQGLVSVQVGNIYFSRGATGTVSRGEWGSVGTAGPILTGPFTFGSGTDIDGYVRLGSPAVVTASDMAGSGWLRVQSGATLEIAATTGGSRIGTLELAGGTVSGAGQLQVDTSLKWATGTMKGSGSTVLAAGASGTMDANDGTLDQRTFRNEGDFAQTTTARLYGKNGAVVDNRGTYSLNVERCSGCSFFPGIYWTPAGDAQPKFVNQGTLQRTAGAASSYGTIDWGFDNQGSVNLTAGTIYFERSAAGAVSQGSWSTTGSAKAQLNGAFTFGSGAQVSGLLLVSSSAGKLTSLGIQGPTGTVQVNTGATLDLGDSGAVSRINGLTLNGGTLTGPGQLRVSGLLSWRGGTMNGSGLTVVEAGATGEVTNDSTLDTRTLRNDGQTSQGGAVRLFGKNGAVLDNRGTFTLNTERCSGCSFDPGVLVDTTSQGQPVFVNTGVLQKTSGAGTSIVSWALDNRGTINAAIGKFDFRGPIIRTEPVPEESYGAGNLATPNVRRSCAGKPVDCATGNQFEVQTDLDVGGRGLGLQMTRTYNSQAAAKQSSAGAFGYGWSASYTDSLLVETAQLRATVTQADGSQVPFTIGSDGKFNAPAWIQAKLVKNADGTYTYTLPDERTSTFDATGRLIAQADRNANKATVNYDASGHLSKVTDPSGRSLDYAYTDGKVTTVTDPAGLTVHYAYDGGELVGVSYEGDADPTWQFDYDTSHQLTSMTDARGGTTVTEYDTSNRAVKQTDALGRIRLWTYLTDETKITEPTGGITHLYFQQGQPTKIVRAEGADAETTQRYVYDDKGRTIEAVDGNGHSTTFTYDGTGNRLTATDPTNRTLRWTYNATNDVMTATSPGGKVTTIERDTRGNPTSVSRTFTDSGGVQRTQKVTMAYDSHGQVVSSKDPLDNETTFEYDAAGNQVASVDPQGNRTTATFDAASRLKTITSPRGNAAGADPSAYTTTFVRDKYGRVIETHDPVGRITSTEYDADGNVTTVTDGAGRTSLAEYDAENQLVKEVLGDGSIRRTSYDDAGNVSSRTDGAGQTTGYLYDDAGNLTEVIDPLGRHTVRRYDANGTLVAVVDALSRSTTYAFDAADRLTDVTYPAPGADHVTYAYDSEGRLASATNSAGQATFDYDGLGRLSATHSAAGDVVRFGYDLADRQTTLTYPNGHDVTTAYDTAGRPTSTTDWLGHTTTFAYDADSNLIRKTYPTDSPTSDEYTFDGAAQLTAASLGQTADGAPQLGYQYGSGGELTSVTSAGLPGATAEAYQYDAAGRLSKDGLADLSFDLAGNATKLKGISTLTYDAAGQLGTATAGESTVDYDFDALGERTSQTPSDGTATNYGYDSTGQLTSFDAPGQPAVAFDYDSEGLRTEKRVNATTTHYAWDVGGPLPQLLAEDGTSYLYGPDGLPLASITSDDEVRYLHSDRLGSVRSVTDSAGARTAAQTFDAYGNVAEHTGEQVPFGFAGQYTDAETGLVYMRARYYDPATGQFLTRDPLENTTQQPYLYAGGDPVNATDPSGLFPIHIDLPSVPSLEDVSNAAAGFGDTVTFGGTRKIREALGVDSAVDYCSGAYGVGGTGGTVIGIAIPVERVIGVGAKLAGSERARGVIGKIGRRLADERGEFDPSAFRRPRAASRKARSSDVPSWVRNHPEGRPFVGESGKDFAKRLLDKRYGEGNWSKTGPSSEYNQIKKYGDRGFE